MQDRERLYEDVIAQKMTSNNLTVENLKLKTRIQILEAELARKDRKIEEMSAF